MSKQVLLATMLSAAIVIGTTFAQSLDDVAGDWQGRLVAGAAELRVAFHLGLADALTRQDVAVLRVDDRGMGGSSPGPLTATSADFATDVQTGIDWLKQRADIDSDRIGLLGHSEGGMIAMMLAAENPDVSFVLLWAAPGIDGGDLIVEQAKAVALSSGASSVEAEQTAIVQRRIVDAILAAPDSESARIAAGNVVREAGLPVSEAELAIVGTPWYRFFLEFDPRRYLERIDAPVLALLGGTDTQVPSERNAAGLREGLSSNTRASMEILPGLNHLFQTSRTGSPQEYASIEETINEQALARMVDWIVEQVSVEGSAGRAVGSNNTVGSQE